MRHAYILACILTIAQSMHATDPDALKARADAYAELEQFEKAIELYMQLCSQDPHDIHSMFGAALCLLKIGHFAESIQLFDRLRVLTNNSLAVQYNVAYAYKTAGGLDTAIKIYKEIIMQNPNYDDAHLGLGFAYLQNGDFIHGWPQHSRYLKKAGKNGEELRELLKNNNLHGKKILLHYEGGLGDTLLFIRYAQRLKNLGAHTICMVQKPLLPLLSKCPYIDTLMPFQTPYPEHHARASLMSLPAIFEDTEDRFTVLIPYIYPDAELVRIWRNRLLSYGSTLKIGITWQSDVHNDVSRLPIARRGIPLALFEPLLRDPRFTFLSLQCLEGLEQIGELATTARLITFENLDTQHGAFMDTAAIIQNLDLVIAVDSAVANISGALGIPTILLLPYVTDWRWIINRTDSPWYPNHRIFKQPKPFDWDSVINEVTQYLENSLLKKDNQ